MLAACIDCIYIADQGLIPLHVVHPERGVPRLYDVRGFAICRDCGGVWYRSRGKKTPELLVCVELR